MVIIWASSSDEQCKIGFVTVGSINTAVNLMFDFLIQIKLAGLVNFSVICALSWAIEVGCCCSIISFWVRSHCCAEMEYFLPVCCCWCWFWYVDLRLKWVRNVICNIIWCTMLLLNQRNADPMMVDRITSHCLALTIVNMLSNFIKIKHHLHYVQTILLSFDHKYAQQALSDILRNPLKFSHDVQHEW